MGEKRTRDWLERTFAVPASAIFFAVFLVGMPVMFWRTLLTGAEFIASDVSLYLKIFLSPICAFLVMAQLAILIELVRGARSFAEAKDALRTTRQVMIAAYSAIFFFIVPMLFAFLDIIDSGLSIGQVFGYVMFIAAGLLVLAKTLMEVAMIFESGFGSASCSAAEMFAGIAGAEGLLVAMWEIIKILPRVILFPFTDRELWTTIMALRPDPPWHSLDWGYSRNATTYPVMMLFMLGCIFSGLLS